MPTKFLVVYQKLFIVYVTNRMTLGKRGKNKSYTKV